MTETDVFNALKGRTYNANHGRYDWHNSAGQFHRTDGPALEYNSGDRFWYQNDQLHRDDGPAVECDDGREFWWLDGDPLSEDEFNQRTKL